MYWTISKLDIQLTYKYPKCVSLIDEPKMTSIASGPEITDVSDILLVESGDAPSGCTPMDFDIWILRKHEGHVLTAFQSDTKYAAAWDEKVFMNDRQSGFLWSGDPPIRIRQLLKNLIAFNLRSEFIKYTANADESKLRYVLDYEAVAPSIVNVHYDGVNLNRKLKIIDEATWAKTLKLNKAHQISVMDLL